MVMLWQADETYEQNRKGAKSGPNSSLRVF